MITMKNIYIFFQILKHSIMSAMEYKLSFLTQIIFMIINNSFFVFIFYLFFLKFKTIWWIEFYEWTILFSLFAFLFSFLHLFVAGFSVISNNIREWKIDSFLLLPIYPLTSILPSKFLVSAIWDLLTSIWIFYLVYIFSDINILWVILLCFKVMFLSIFSSFIILWFMIFFHSLSFYLWSSDQLSRWAFEAILWPSMYPPAIYESTFLKPLFMTILPVFYIVFLPFKLVSDFNILDFSILVFASIFSMFLWIFTFNRWLKKYESGNMMNTNL